MSVTGLILAASLSGGAVAADVSTPTNTAPASVASAVSSTNKPPARITSDSTYYDRKEGLAIFKGHVHVDDVDYQMHARRAYVFMDAASNTLSRIAATGGIALTNGLRRAYGEKLTYSRETGLIVLHGDAKDASRPAVVIEDTAEGPRTVRGKTIRFWINSEQVEVEGAILTAPGSAKSDLPFALPGK